MNPSTRLTKKVSKEVLAASHEVLEALMEILNEELRSKEKELRMMETLNLESVARNIGEQRQIEKMRQLLNVR